MHVLLIGYQRCIGLDTAWMLGLVRVCAAHGSTEVPQCVTSCDLGWVPLGC
jgi:hypothetical protein